jgi:hypothetical protein
MRYQTTRDVERGTWPAPAERKAARKQDKAARKEARRQARPSQWALQTALLGVRLPGLALFPKRGGIDAKGAQ